MGRPAVCLDRDGVIKANRPGHVKSWDQFAFLPGVFDPLRLLAHGGQETLSSATRRPLAEAWSAPGWRRRSIGACRPISRTGAEIEPELPDLCRFGDTRHVFSDVSKLSATGWRPTVDLEEILGSCVA